MKEAEKTPPKRMAQLVSFIDVKIILALGICLLSAHILPEFQIVTGCVAILICMQDGMKQSVKAGLVRLMMVAIGGMFAIGVIVLDDAAHKRLIFLTLVLAGVLIILRFCKLVKIPFASARIGTITFILVVMTMDGSSRIRFAFLRLYSTLYGVALVVLVSAVFMLFAKKETDRHA